MPQLIILDRDGVINQDSDDYVKSADEWLAIDGSVEAIADLSRAGYRIAVATNQSGLARKLFDLDDLEAMHDKLSDLVEAQQGHIEGIFYCPHHPDEHCYCRKPGTGLITAIETELECSAVDAFFIGDSLKDLQAAKAKSCQPILVRTGKGQKTETQIAGKAEWADVLIFDNLALAARHIMDTL
jgi:D-glycero-D-manno-heptose 1,7-bisphosphate phosphatase